MLLSSARIRTLTVISSAYLTNKLEDLTGFISFIIKENNIGPSTVPWGTPLVIYRSSVGADSALRRGIKTAAFGGLNSVYLRLNNQPPKFVDLTKSGFPIPLTEMQFCFRCFISFLRLLFVQRTQPMKARMEIELFSQLSPR